jgi:hypothetical protein
VHNRGVLDHGGQSQLDIFSAEFADDVIRPEFDVSLGGHGFLLRERRRGEMAKKESDANSTASAYGLSYFPVSPFSLLPL